MCDRSTWPQVTACWRCTSSLFLTALPWKLVSDAATFSGPVFLRLLLSAVASGVRAHSVLSGALL